MTNKNSMPQKTNFIKHATEESLTELIELSDNHLQQIVGGCGCGGHTTTTTTTTTTSNAFSSGSAGGLGGDWAGGSAGEFIP